MICDIMKILIRILTAFLTIIIVSSVCACDFDESEKKFYGGELLNNEKLSEIKGSIFTEEDKTESNTEEKTESIDKDTDAESESMLESVFISDFESETQGGTDEEEILTVYWTKNGSVWHIDGECYRLNKSKEILSGSVEEAKESGKERVCSSCGK